MYSLGDDGCLEIIPQNSQLEYESYSINKWFTTWLVLCLKKGNVGGIIFFLWRFTVDLSYVHRNLKPI